MAAVERERLRLCHRAASGRDPRWPQRFAPQHVWIVEIDQLRAVSDLECGERERQTAAAEHRRREPLAAERGELFDNAGFGAIREIEAAVDVGIIVAPFPLEHARKPQRSVGLIVAGGRAPGETAIERHANESARSARMARISSSVRPARTKSIGRRSPRRGLTPNSHDSAASRS